LRAQPQADIEQQYLHAVENGDNPRLVTLVTRPRNRCRWCVNSHGTGQARCGCSTPPPRRTSPRRSRRSSCSAC
jgi:hypothetical protein